VVGSQWWERARGLEQIEEFIDRRNKYTQGRVDAGTVKIMQDGVMENYTAAMLEPYNLEGSPKGIPMIEPEFLKTAVAALDREGFQVHFHAIGDAAIRQCLDAVEYARSENGDSDLRHHISHLELIDPQDIPRFAGLDVVANFQPLWAYPDSYVTDLTLPFIGEERGKWLYPIGSVVESGGTIAFGSDWSVSTANPFPQIEVAVTRADPTGDVEGTLAPEQAITLEEAIVAFTINAAFVNRLDKESGSLEVGKSADLAVLDRNLFEVDPQDISETRVILTMLEGEVVYEAETGTK
jgi:predicted amidohydrolase YtcJ